MRKQLFLLVLIFLCKIVNAQTVDGYTMGIDGMAYKIISDGKGSLLELGNYMEMHFTSILSSNGKDSVLNNSRDLGQSQIMLFDTTTLPANYFEIFKTLKVGDSLSTKTLVDELFKKQPESMPPFFKLGDYVYTNVRLLKIYKTEAEAEIVIKENTKRAEEIAKAKAAVLVSEDDNTLKEFISKNNIVALKSPKGAYVQILNEGTGSKLNNNQFVKINYTGKTLNGKMFDSNTDSSKGHVEPLSVNLTDDLSLGNGVIPGMVDALLMMQKGTKAVMYIPSGLAYGPRAAGNDIPANSNLIFEVEVLSVLSKAQVIAAKASEEKKMKVTEGVKAGVTSKKKIVKKAGKENNTKKLKANNNKTSQKK
jgi:FKBP-type peptidyl-prolyl cis-trans isomerase FkpA